MQSMQRDNKELPKKKGGSQLRKSDTGPGLLMPKGSKAVSKSAGNTPNTSPVVNKAVLQNRNITKRRNLVEELKIDTETGTNLKEERSSEDDIDVEDIGDIRLGAETPNTHKDQCPCFNTGSKSNLHIKCCKCNQVFHPTCVNLAGLTKSTTLKLTKWKCPDCYIFPYTKQSNEKSEAFSEFLKIIPRISQCNEDLRDSATTIEFFNEHIKHLVINEDSHKEQSEKINQLETDVKHIKSSLERLSRLSEQKNELEIPKLEMFKQMKAQLQDLTHTVNSKTFFKPLESTSGDLSTIKDTLININERGLVLEKSGDSIRQEIDNLKDVIKQQEEHQVPQRGVDSFNHIDSIITDINRQLRSISDHVCPNGGSDNVPHDNQQDLSPPMTPNTSSPHFDPLPSQRSSSPACDPYVKYTEDVVPDALSETLLQLIESSSADFTEIGGSRDVLYFGEHGYWYTGAYHQAKPIPLELQDLIDCVRPSLPNKKSWLNSCLITRYKGANSHIPMHCDNEVNIDPESVIVTVSLGQERTIKFTHNSSSNERKLTLKDRSVYVMSRLSQEVWKHEIEPLNGEEDTSTVLHTPQEESEGHVVPPNSAAQEGVRYSFTFRHIAPFFKNSTVIVGDSNTKYIKFGNDVGTLGKWLPGKRMLAATIKDIPSPQEIGPYRNIVIHTGINDIRDDFNRPSNRALIAQLKRKCDDIQEFYPNAKLHLSLLLPTKSQNVNVRIGELNSMMIDFVFNRRNMFVIDNSILSSQNGCMPPKYGRFMRNGTPLTNDVVHLGREGLRVFCMNIKRCITQRGERQSAERFRGGSGDYRSALDRGRRSSISPR